MIIREYQNEVIDYYANKGEDREIIYLPTGAGKTIVSAEIIKNYIKNVGSSKRILFLADRKKIIEQSERKVGVNSTSIDIISPQKLSRIFTNARNLENIKEFLSPHGLIIIDECHIVYRSLVVLFEQFKGNILGLSATPFNKILKDYFKNDLISSASIKSLVDMGYLVNPKFKVLDSLDLRLDKVRVIGSEYDSQEIDELIIGCSKDIVNIWINNSELRKTLVFANSINQCKSLSSEFNSRGINAKVCCSGEDYDAHVSDFEFGNVRVLLTVSALSRGFDSLKIKCILDARPLLNSFNEFVQMAGRGTRIDEGKEDFLYLDLVGNTLRFGDGYSLLYNGKIKTISDGLVFNLAKSKSNFFCPHCEKLLPRKIEPREYCPYECGYRKTVLCKGCLSDITDQDKCYICQDTIDNDLFNSDIDDEGEIKEKELTGNLVDINLLSERKTDDITKLQRINNLMFKVDSVFVAFSRNGEEMAIVNCSFRFGKFTSYLMLEGKGVYYTKIFLKLLTRLVEFKDFKKKPRNYNYYIGYGDFEFKNYRWKLILEEKNNDNDSEENKRDTITDTVCPMV